VLAVAVAQLRAGDIPDLRSPDGFGLYRIFTCPSCSAEADQWHIDLQ
jgi:hypothetical protein